MNNVELSEQLTRLLMESYDKGVEDTKAAALKAVERAVAVAIAVEREACADECVKQAIKGGFAADCAAAIRARGNNAN